MPPTLRSSAPNSPASKGSVRSNPPSPPRKIPCCLKCGRPRAGHPRSGCPFVRQTQEPELTDALGSLQLISPADDNKAAVRIRHRSLRVQATVPEASPTSPSPPLFGQAVHSFSQLSILRDDSPDDGMVNQRMRRILRWQETVQVVPESIPSPPPPPLQPYRSVPVSAPQRSKSVMPGTLLTPNSSILGSPGCSPPPPDPPCATHVFDSTSTAGPATPRPLARSLSVEERNAFLNGLVETAHAPPASVFTIPMGEIYQIQHSAAKVGFFSRVVPSLEDDENGWLILGSDDKAVQMLFEGVNGNKQPRSREGQSRGTFRAAAGGAVVGAVATFTGLAFT